MSVMTNGWNSRQKSRLAVRRVQHVPKHDENTLALTSVDPSDEEIVDVKPLQVSRDMVTIPGPKRSLVRLDSYHLIFDGVIHWVVFLI